MEKLKKIHKIAINGYWIQALKEATNLLKSVTDENYKNLIMAYRRVLLNWLKVTPQPKKAFEPITKELSIIIKEIENENK